MTERLTKGMAAAVLRLPALPDPMRLDQVARLLGGGDEKAVGHWLFRLRQAAKGGELATQEIMPEPYTRVVIKRAVVGWERRRVSKQVKELFQPPAYQVVALAELRAFLEQHGEEDQIPPWLAEVPAAPSLSSVRRKASLKAKGYTEADVERVQAAARAYCEKVKAAGRRAPSVLTVQNACPVRPGTPAPKTWVQPIVREYFPPAKRGRPKKPQRRPAFADLAAKLTK